MHMCSNLESYVVNKSNIGETTKHLLNTVAHILAKSRSINYRSSGLSAEFEQYCNEKGFTYVKVEDSIGSSDGFLKTEFCMLS